MSGLAVLLKPVFLYYEVVSLLVLFLSLIKVDVYRFLKYALVHCLFFFLAISPWCLRNWLIWDEILVTPNSGSHLYHYIRPLLLAEMGLPTTDPSKLLNGGDWDGGVFHKHSRSGRNSSGVRGRIWLTETRFWNV